MTYEICFIRSNADDRQAFKTGLYLVGHEREKLITRKLGSAGIKALPVLKKWCCPIFDEDYERYEMTARFTTCLPMAEVEQLFRLALAHGLGGDFRIRELPIAFKRMVSLN